MLRGKVECFFLIFISPPGVRDAVSGLGGRTYSDQTANSPPPGASK